jgi:hypothetical protein
MVRRALCKTIKVALTKELGKKQSYFIKSKWKTLMNKQPFTEQLPS